jgi:osmoprotectant transport system substrate-binding protein
VTSLRSVFALTLSGALLMAACGSDEDASSDTVPAAARTINVISSADPVSQLLGEVYGQALENAGFRIGRKNPVADEAAAYAAVESGKAQLTIETTVALLSRLDSSATEVPVTVDEQTTAINEALPDTLAANPVSSVDAGLVVACTTDAVEANTLTDISSLAKVAGDITLGIPEGFDTATPVGLATLAAAYDTEFTDTVTLAAADIADAVTEKSFDCVVASGLTPAITLSGLLPLTDDKGALPVDMVVPLLTIDASQPELVSMITTINASLTTQVVRALLVKVDNGANTYDTAAKAFLASLSSNG